MKLDKFISSVLHDINSGLSQAESKTGRKYGVKVNNGISFDIAVTATDEKGKTSGIGVVAASLFSVGAKGESKVTNQEISRIQFTVVPQKQTEEEKQADLVAFRQSNENLTEDQTLPETF